jgi:hypothetical protein
VADGRIKRGAEGEKDIILICEVEQVRGRGCLAEREEEVQQLEKGEFWASFQQNVEAVPGPYRAAREAELRPDSTILAG